MQARSEAFPVSSDPLLHPFLNAETEVEAQCRLGEVMTGVQPLVLELARSRQISTSFDGSQSLEIEDVASEVLLLVVARLRELREQAGAEAIGNFRGYVATVVHNCWTQRLRRKYPERQKVKNSLRYILNHDSRFAMWRTDNGTMVCGLAQWKDRADFSRSFQLDVSRANSNLRNLRPRDLLDALFSLAAKPIEMEELVGIVGKIWGIQDLRRVEIGVGDDAEENPWMRLPVRREDVASSVERRMYLAALWKEICDLRPLQRTALLLNLHDASGQDMLPLFMLLDVARLSELASSLAMETEELAELWHSLPLEDATIAKRMGITRQQVINLRKSARERLARRMAKSW